MVKEAAEAGLYTSPIWQKDYPRLQILTIEALLAPPESILLGVSAVLLLISLIASLGR